MQVEYTPDHWGIVKVIPSDSAPYYRILCSWSSSYLYGSSWKLSSGIETFEDNDQYWVSLQSSGSTYKLRKQGEQLSAMMASVLSQLDSNIVKVQLVKLEEFLADFTKDKNV